RIVKFKRLRRWLSPALQSLHVLHRPLVALGVGIFLWGTVAEQVPEAPEQQVGNPAVEYKRVHERLPVGGDAAPAACSALQARTVRKLDDLPVTVLLFLEVGQFFAIDHRRHTPLGRSRGYELPGLGSGLD